MSPSSRPAWLRLMARHKLLSALGVLLAATLVLDVAGVGDPAASTGQPSDGASSGPPAAEPSPTPAERSDEPSPVPDDSQPASAGEARSPAEDSTSEPSSDTAGETKQTPAPPIRSPEREPTRRVTRVIDGDTVELGNGQSVRVVGIDAPERGECHFETATRRMEQLVLGRSVRLATSDEDRDRYGRLLRYVDVGHNDAGLQLIRAGLATARYDSRDGYGRHPREDRYIRVDARTPQRTCTSPASPQPSAPPSSSCADGYTPCIPAYPPDVNCADVNGPIRVTGSDPHGLDRDSDGIACEG